MFAIIPSPIVTSLLGDQLECKAVAVEASASVDAVLAALASGEAQHAS